MSLKKKFNGFAILNRGRFLWSAELYDDKNNALEALIDCMGQEKLTPFLESNEIVIVQASLEYDAGTVKEYVPAKT